MFIEKIDDLSEELCELIDSEFSKYAKKHDVVCDYNDFCFVAKDGDKVMGIIAGHSYYKEVQVTDLIVLEAYRGQDIGSVLVRKVEEEFKGKRFEHINLTTYGFQALEFYKKLGFDVEYTRENKDEKLTKYFLIKSL